MDSFDFLRPSADAGFFHVDNSLGVDVRLFANREVPLERAAFEQLFEFLDLVRALSDLEALEKRGAAQFFSGVPAGIDRVVLTPDFHKGALVPVGTVVRARNLCIPRAIGND